MRARISRFSANWSGGSYIDVCVDGRAVDVINVWDYEKGRPLATAPRTNQQLTNLLKVWLEENNDNLADFMMLSKGAM